MSDDPLTQAADALYPHFVTRRSDTSGPPGTYRVWMTCRCGWVSEDLPDGNIPIVRMAELSHYAQALDDAGLLQVRDWLLDQAEAERSSGDG